MSRQFPAKPLKLGIDFPALISLLLAIAVTTAPVLSPSPQSVFAAKESQGQTILTEKMLAQAFHGSLAPAPLADRSGHERNRVMALSTSTMNLGAMDMSAFGDVE